MVDNHAHHPHPAGAPAITPHHIPAARADLRRLALGRYRFAGFPGAAA